jgi:adenylate kinase family enzyme
MKRIAVIGCSAAGKSTLARELGERLGLQVVHLDQVLWEEGCKLTPPHEESAKVLPLLNLPTWVIDGNYTASLAPRLAAADTVVLVDFSRTRCFFRALKRMFTHWGQKRPTMGDCHEELNLGFLYWIWRYPHEERPRLLEHIRQHAPHAHIVTLRSQREIDRWLKEINGHKTK